MSRILELLQDPEVFNAFINENMKTSTFKIGWDAEMDVEYEPTKHFSEATAEYAAAMIGTVVGRDSERPKHGMPDLGTISGALSHMSDEWQIPNERLEKLYFMEGRYNQKVSTLTDVQKKEQYAKLIKYIFNPYEIAAIAPHKRIMSQYLEIQSDAQVTLTKTNNKGGIVWSKALPIDIRKTILGKNDVVWSTETLATMDVIKVLQAQEDYATSIGKTVLKHRVSKATAALICQCDQFKKLIGTNFGNNTTLTTPGIGLNTINAYLATINGTGIAPIEVVNEFGYREGLGNISLFKDGRVASICAPKVAVLKVSEPLEAIDPLASVTYANYKDNLISQWRDPKGRYVAYEMFAFPAFTGKSDIFIVDVTQKAS